MKTLTEIRNIVRRQSDILADKYGVAVVDLFGSYARGEPTGESDLDVLAEFLRPISLLELVGAEMYLSEVLGVRADLVPKRDVRAELRAFMRKEAVALCAETSSSLSKTSSRTCGMLSSSFRE